MSDQELWIKPPWTPMSALLYTSEPEHSRSLGLGSLAMEAFTQQALWALGSGVCASGRMQNRHEGPGGWDSALLGWKTFGPHFLALLLYLGPGSLVPGGKCL